MDVHALLNCFGATLNPDQSIRQQAEAQLRQAERHIGFLGACLDILSSAEVNPGIKTATAVFFKNRIVRRWNDDFNSTAEDRIDNDEKPVIRDRILQTLVSLPPKLRKQLVPVLNTIIKTDYPKQWPRLVENALELLYTQNLDAAYTGLLCFKEVASSYRWTSNGERPELDALIAAHFSTLLQVAETLLKEESPEAGEMTVLLLKTYKYATYHDLPHALQTEDSVTSWGAFHVGAINKPLPQYVMDLDESERRLNPWVKTKKWAYANLNRLFQRYASVSLSKRYEYTAFKDFYVGNFVPQLLNLYLTQIDQWCSHKLWIGEESLYHLISFLENSITQKQTWPLIKPNFELLVSHFIFPLLCPSDSTLDKFENDPEDYIHTKLDIYDDNNSADLAAMSLLLTLTSKKKKTTLETILQFAFNLLTQYKDPTSQSIEDAKKLEGSLRLIGTLSSHFTNEKSPYYSQMEQFLSNLVIPHFENPHPFIKARTSDIISKFSDITFTNDANLGALYRGILGCFQDEHLPVQLEAALALQSFVKVPQFQEALGSVIVPTMQKLLVLSNTIEAEAISGVMQELVEVYSEQLQPFGADLMTNLVEQFLRLAKELQDASNVNVDDLDGEYDDLSDKQMAALGLLNTMITVLLSFESSADVVFNLEEIFYPVIEFVFSNDLEDFFREAGELIENSTFLTRSISSVAWKSFERIVSSLTNGVGVLYIEDLMPALNNFLVYGAEEFKTNPTYTNAVVQLFNHILSSEDASSEEIAYGGEIAQKLILALGHRSEPFIKDILTKTINAVINAETTPAYFAVNMINVVVSSFINHRVLALTTLHQGNFILPFFNLWFQYIQKLTRVYDMKLSTLGLLSLIGLTSDEIVQLQMTTLVPEFGHKLAILMDKLPEAIQNLDKRRKEYDGEEYEGRNVYDYDDEWENEDVDDDTEAAAGDDYLNFLAEEAKKLKSSGQFNDDDGDFEDDEDFVEDALANTILDNVNVFFNFKETALNIQATDPVKYQQVFGGLTPEEQETLQNVIEL